MAPSPLDDLSSLITTQLTEIIRDGVPAVGPDGQILTDGDGKIIRKPAPAAYFGHALKMLAQAGISPAGGAEDLRAQLEGHGIRLVEHTGDTPTIPDIDEEEAA